MRALSSRFVAARFASDAPVAPPNQTVESEYTFHQPARKSQDQDPHEFVKTRASLDPERLPSFGRKLDSVSRLVAESVNR